MTNPSASRVMPTPTSSSRPLSSMRAPCGRSSCAKRSTSPVEASSASHTPARSNPATVAIDSLADSDADAHFDLADTSTLLTGHAHVRPDRVRRHRCSQLQSALNDAGVPGGVSDEIIEVNSDARIDALRVSFAVAALLAVAALFFTARVPTTALGTVKT